MLPSVKMSTSDLAGALASSKISEPSGAVGGFLKFDFKTGEWLYGRDQDDVTDDVVVVNTASIGHGWVLWHNGKATKTMAAFNAPLPTPMEGIGDDAPAEGRVFQGAFLDDIEAGAEPVQFTFETNSYGGRSGVDTLLSSIKAKAIQGSTFLYPAVQLTSSSYLNKKHGSTIHNPVFQIVDWYDADGVKETEQAAVAAETKAEVKTEAKAEAPEKAETEEAPKRRRRRRATS